MFIVESVTKNINTFSWFELFFNDKISKLLYWWIINIKCLLLKIVDRKNNLQTIYRLKKEKQIRMTFETQAIYFPLIEILEFYKDSNIKEKELLLKAFMKKKKLNTEENLKEELYNNTFKWLDSNLFELIYKNSSFINWEINDINMYEKFINIKWMSEKISDIKLKLKISWVFSAKFKFIKWISSNNNSKMNINSFSF